MKSCTQRRRGRREGKIKDCFFLSVLLSSAWEIARRGAEIAEKRKIEDCFFSASSFPLLGKLHAKGLRPQRREKLKIEFFLIVLYISAWAKPPLQKKSQPHNPFFTH